MFGLGSILKFLWMKDTKNVCYYHVVLFPYPTSHHRTDHISQDCSTHTFTKFYPFNLMIIAHSCHKTTVKVKQSWKHSLQYCPGKCEWNLFHHFLELEYGKSMFLPILNLSSLFLPVVYSKTSSGTVCKLGLDIWENFVYVKHLLIIVPSKLQEEKLLA